MLTSRAWGVCTSVGYQSSLSAFPLNWESQVKKRGVDRPELPAQRLAVRKMIRIRGRFLRTTLQLANSSRDCFYSVSERCLMLPPFRRSSEELSESDLLLTYELTKSRNNKGKLPRKCFLGTIKIMWPWKVHWKLDLLARIYNQRSFKSLFWVFGVGCLLGDILVWFFCSCCCCCCCFVIVILNFSLWLIRADT